MPPPTSPAPLLVITPGIHAARSPRGVVLDEKSFAGLEEFVRHWPGRVRCVYREGPPAALQFGRERAWNELPCELVLVPPGSAIAPALVGDAAVVLACGDNFLDLPLARTCRQLDVPLVYVIENTLPTRVRIALLEHAPAWMRAKSALWHAWTEPKRQAAFRLADGLAMNGADAARTYGRAANDVVTFFDGRTTREMMASPAELAAKTRRVLEGKPLRLGFSGRLEPLKGADHLVRVARCLAEASLPFTLDIFGSGSLAPSIRRQIDAARLGRQVTLHGTADFGSVLVPFFRHNIDVFLCCHRQSDPSCTYLEAMACAVAIAGYGNRALLGLLEHAPAGVGSPVGNPERLAHAIAALAARREDLAQMMRHALAFASAHDVATTFQRRVQQCVRVAGRAHGVPADAASRALHA